MKRKTMGRWLTVLLCAALAVTLAPLNAFAYINRGDVEIIGKDSCTLQAGEKAYVSVRPFQEDHLPGCQMDICPDECGDGCIIYINGAPECICNGTEMETYYAQVEVTSSNEAVASAEYNERGTVVIRARSAGTAEVHIDAAFREYNPAEKTVRVTVK